MYRERKRERRIRDALRLWARTRRIYASCDNCDWLDEIACRLFNNRTPCSGPCCGNPRRWFGELTVQELRARDDHDDQVLNLERESE
jgi:hypothetical protein